MRAWLGRRDKPGAPLRGARRNKRVGATLVVARTTLVVARTTTPVVARVPAGIG